MATNVDYDVFSHDSGPAQQRRGLPPGHPGYYRYPLG
jgi:hypothetical protein